MSEISKTSEASGFRERIAREDDLLNSRTTVFLVTNGLLLNAAGPSSGPLVGLLISVLGSTIAVAWLICSWQSWSVIKSLAVEYRRRHHNEAIEKAVQRALFKPGWRRPTDLIAKPLPAAFIITWSALLVIKVAALV